MRKRQVWVEPLFGEGNRALPPDFPAPSWTFLTPSRVGEVARSAVAKRGATPPGLPRSRAMPLRIPVYLALLTAYFIGAQREESRRHCRRGNRARPGVAPRTQWRSEAAVVA